MKVFKNSKKIHCETTRNSLIKCINKHLWLLLVMNLLLTFKQVCNEVWFVLFQITSYFWRCNCSDFNRFCKMENICTKCVDKCVQLKIFKENRKESVSMKLINHTDRNFFETITKN